MYIRTLNFTLKPSYAPNQPIGNLSLDLPNWLVRYLNHTRIRENFAFLKDLSLPKIFPRFWRVKKHGALTCSTYFCSFDKIPSVPAKYDGPWKRRKEGRKLARYLKLSWFIEKVKERACVNGRDVSLQGSEASKGFEVRARRQSFRKVKRRAWGYHCGIKHISFNESRRKRFRGAVEEFVAAVPESFKICLSIAGTK
jgi:hypothetical protein